jgi:hypothetical protein
MPKKRPVDHAALAANVAKLPHSVALYADRNNTPYLPWETPRPGAHPIVVKAGEVGYWRVNDMLDVDHYNSDAFHGEPASMKQIAAMLYGSMFGFDAPCADVDSFEDDGTFRRNA